jgi:hypothetical protein
MAIDRLRSERLIENVEADPKGAAIILDACERHLASAAAIAVDDPSGAFQLAYDAARKAINAHMLANGLRAVRGARIGAHAVVGRYAVAVLANEAGDAVRSFDRMRQRRNRTEYGVVQIERAQVDVVLEHATSIVAAARISLGR